MIAARGGVRRRFSLALALKLLAVAIVTVLTLQALFHIRVSQALFRQPNMVAAFGVNPDDGMAAGYLAWTMLGSPAEPAAEGLARLALARTPLSASAVTVLAARAADPMRSERLFAHALAMGWRDPVAQRHAARRALGEGRLDDAARHADAAARVWGMTAETRALIDRFALDPAARPALVRRLLLLPAWRIAYLNGEGSARAALGPRVALVSALRGTPAAAEPRAIATLVRQAQAQSGYAAAYAAWSRMVPARDAGPVQDPLFARLDHPADDATLFDWQYRAVPGAAATIAAGGRGLEASADGASVEEIARQVVRLAPGRRRLRIAGSSADGLGGSAFRWTLYCYDRAGRGRPLAPVAGVATGAAQLVFDIPADGSCDFQSLSLQTQQGDLPGHSGMRFTAVRVD